MSEKAKPLTAEQALYRKAMSGPLEPEENLRLSVILADDTSQFEAAYDDVVGTLDKLDAARERIAELEAALTFYADEANWRTRGHPQIDAHDTAINFDRGATARNAIRPQPWCTDPVACRAAGRCPHDPVCGD